MTADGPTASSVDFGRTYWRSAPAASTPLPELSASSVDDTTFRLLADNLPTLCWIANGDGYIVWYNRRWHDYCGTTPDQMEGWGWQSVHDPALLPSVMDRWTAAIASGEPFEMTFPLRGGDGVFRPFLTRIQPVRDASGKVARWFGTNTEIFDQVTAEAALRAERDRSRGVLESMAEGFVLLGRDFRVLDINTEGLRIDGRSREEVLGRSHWEVWPGTEASEQGRLYRRVMADGVAGQLEIHYRWDDGHEVWLDVRAYPHPEGVAIFYRDITDKRAAEAAVAASEQRLRLVVDGARDYAIFTIDPERRITSWSQGAAEIFGYSAEEAIGQPADVIFTPEDRAADRPILEVSQARREGCAPDERWHLRKDGARVFMNGSVHPLPPDANGREQGFIKIARNETEQRSAADTVAESEARFRNMADNAPVMMWVTDPGGFCTYLNRRWYEFTGQEVGAGEGYGWLDAVHSDDQPIAEQAFVSANAEQHDYRVEFRVRRADGVYRWAIDAAAARFSAAGEYLGYVGSVIDIDERREAEQRLQRSEARFRDIANSIDQMVWSTRPDGFHDFYNQRWYDFTGVPDGSTDGEAWNGMFHPEDQERAWARWRHSLTTGEHYEIEYRLRHRSGAYRWVLGRAQPVRDEAGAITRWYGTCTDIHDQKLAEDALRESRDLLAEESQALEILNRTGTQVAAELGLKSLVQSVVDAGVALTGARFGAFFYNVLDEAGASYMLYALAGAERRAFEGFGMPRATSVFAPTFRGEGVIRSADILADPRYGKNAPHSGMPAGHLPVRSYLAVPVTSRSGEVIGGLFFGHEEPGIFSERSERVMTGLAAQAAIGIDNARLFDAVQKANAELEERVRERTAELETAHEALRQSQKMEAVGQLTGGIAHDFNNMLAVVIGSLDLLGRRIGTGDARAKRYVDAAADGARRAALLTQRLLAFSRQQPLRPEPVDANKLVAGMSELIRGSLGSDIRLETVLASGLWRTHADPNQLENVLLNLAVNARDAMPDGGRLTIETSNAHLDARYVAAHLGVAAGQYVMIAVTDTGSGMPAEIMAKVFDPFFTTKPVGKGTGLGLSQVYGFVKQSGGHVKIYSEPGQGTTVKVYLPRLLGAEHDIVQDEGLSSLPLGESQEVILVVEDEPAVRQFSVDALGELGYRVFEADGGAAALRLLDAHPEIALLFTDIVMPDVNGRKLADEAHQRRPDLKVLFTTGYTRNAVVHNGVLDPGVELIGKPFTIEELAAKVREVLDGPATVPAH